MHAIIYIFDFMDFMLFIIKFKKTSNFTHKSDAYSLFGFALLNHWKHQKLI